MDLKIRICGKDSIPFILHSCLLHSTLISIGYFNSTLIFIGYSNSRLISIGYSNSKLISIGYFNSTLISIGYFNSTLISKSCSNLNHLVVRSAIIKELSLICHKFKSLGLII